MWDEGSSPLQSEEVEETQDDEPSQTIRNTPYNEEKQQSDHVTIGQGKHAPAVDTVEGKGETRGENTLGPRG